MGASVAISEKQCDDTGDDGTDHATEHSPHLAIPTVTRSTIGELWRRD